MTPKRRRWRRALRTLKTTLALLLIGFALLVALAALALPSIVAHPETVRAFLAERLKRPVAFERLTAEWLPSGPLFQLEGLTLGDPALAPFEIARAELAIDFYAGLSRDVSLVEFRLIGLAIDAERGDDGHWRIAGLGAGRSDSGGLEGLFDLGSVSLRDARLRLSDPGRDLELTLARLDARLVGGSAPRRVGGTAWASADSEPLRFACEIDSAASRCHFGARGLEPGHWLERLPPFDVDVVAGALDADVWLGFDRGLASLRVELATRELVLRGRQPVEFSDGDAIEPRLRLDDWRAAADWRRSAAGWRLGIDQWRGSARRPTTRVRVEHDAAAGTTAIEADRVQLEDWAALLALDSRVPGALRRWLYEPSPRGRIDDLRLLLGADGVVALDAGVGGLGFNPGSRTPGIARVDGRLRGDAGVLLFEPVAGSALELSWPHVFRQPIAFRLARGYAALLPGEVWRLELAELELDGGDWGAAGQMGLAFNGARPALDAVLRVAPGSSVAAARQFWPVNAMPPVTVRWLDRALDSGTVDEGMLAVAGDLDDWPFRNAAGRFDAMVSVTGVELDYHPEWPSLTLDRATADFSAYGMAIRDAGGALHDARIVSGSAVIADFRQPVLGLKIAAEGSGETLLRVLRESPIRRRLGAALVGVSVGGHAAIEFDLTQPLKKELGESRLFGTGTLTAADLADAKHHVAFSQASGRLRFSDRGFAADDLAVTFGGDPAAFSLAAGEFTADAEHLVEATLRGELGIATVLGGLRGLAPWWARFPGRSAWSLDLTVERPPAGGGAGSRRLTLRSDLVGTAIELPAPLRKDAASALPVDITVALPLAGGQLALGLGQLLSLEARLPGPDAPLAASVALGVAERAPLPAAGVLVRGDVVALDLGGWAGIGLDRAGGGGLGLDVDLSAAELALLSRGFSDARVRIKQRAEDTLVGFEGAQILGWLSLPREARASRGVDADFQRLHLPERIPGVEVEALDPRRLPALHLRIADLRLGAAQLGEAVIETVPSATGLAIERLETRSPSVSLRARGTWMLDAGGERTRLEADFSADNLGRMLDALGFAGAVDGGETSARLAGDWPGSPDQFSLARIDGALEARVGRGTVLDVEPGAGRVFGLMSIAAAPRRLALDFSDFFGKGLSFDSIDGRFELKSGDAFTDNLTVNSPSAEIRIVGRTGLARRDYDQELVVTPKVGSVLPLVGAIAGGPVGAAAGLVAQGVLKNPLDEITRARYRVSGGWERPAVELIARERRRGVVGAANDARGGGAP